MWLEYTKAEQPTFWNNRKWKCPTSPVVEVSWYEAYAFTRWLTTKLNDGYEYRLLDENEWETAASGFEKREYPWGNAWDKNRCNNNEINLERTSPVGIFKNGDTPNGISDLSGNVWEWTSSDYHSGKNFCDFQFDIEMQKLWEEKSYDAFISKLDEKGRQAPVLRGGSWYNAGDLCRCADRDGDEPGRHGDGDVGFRCARDS